MTSKTNKKKRKSPIFERIARDIIQKLRGARTPKKRLKKAKREDLDETSRKNQRLYKQKPKNTKTAREGSQKLKWATKKKQKETRHPAKTKRMLA